MPIITGKNPRDDFRRTSFGLAALLTGRQLGFRWQLLRCLSFASPHAQQQDYEQKRNHQRGVNPDHGRTALPRYPARLGGGASSPQRLSDIAAREERSLSAREPADRPIGAQPKLQGLCHMKPGEDSARIWKTCFLRKKQK